ncbi:WXG100 family type VII secretion target [Antrihabitans cavernicola]|uniref:ESAT-6-like protein n=1 Tax=Antrihabitans cavernicola TaxID=2495913 RepID=A0A5A7S6H1_9NOCA|nr:WXG100 family type VII secretion target [Spelaeibacter cavernicola]KAA0018530.1 WXG100 family type VII secretion target [Spelaeibacter cavernicola]
MNMSGEPLHVVPEEVTSVGRFAYEIAEQLRSGSTRLDGEVQGLSATWRGSAADSYRSGWDEMHHGAVQVWDALFQMAEKLGVTADTYRTQDSASASALGSLNI